MTALKPFRIRPLSEVDLDRVFDLAGGLRAHPDHDRREELGSDYLLGDALIELKSLNDEGLAKPQRQAKLAALFREELAPRPVMVLDRALLSEEGRHRYDRILETPIKTAVAKARKQLEQSRLEHPQASTTVLMVVNNGYTALDHESLKTLVAHRVRNDTREIDGVVVAGCYFYTDGFDSYFLWPIDYVPINMARRFSRFRALKDAWDGLATELMTDLVQGRIPEDAPKGAVVDAQFDVNGVTYVKPSPPIGKPSAFYGPRRPRSDSSGLTVCPPVALTFPELSRAEFSRLLKAADDPWPF